MNENKIQSLLRSKYNQTSKIIIENIYFFRYDWESDVFIVKTNGYIYEIEIKISVSDFKADSKKVDKHNRLKSKLGFIPNKFFYCTPKGLLKLTDIPDYAGLIEIGEGGFIENKKEAPFLHKEKLDYHKKITDKLYNRWRAEVVHVKNLRQLLNNPNLFNQ
jgi:hypothetical protein